MDEARPTLYASRRIDRPVHAVVGDIETFLTRRDWRPVDGTGPSRSRTAPRAFRGVLRKPSGLGIARVELEVLAWSDRATELGLRPVGARARRAACRAPYGAAASTLLDGLADRSARPVRVRGPARLAAPTRVLTGPARSLRIAGGTARRGRRTAASAVESPRDA